MKKLWLGIGILLVASFSVYGVVTQVNSGCGNKAVLQADTAQGTCPFAQQAALTDSGSCTFKGDAAQTASADGGCCAADKEQRTAAADASYSEAKMESQDSARTALADGTQ